MEPIRLDTLGALHAYRHGIIASCPRCRRSADVDLAALVARGLGDRSVLTFRPRCSVCGTRGQIQLGVPMDAWPTHLRRPEA